MDKKLCVYVEGETGIIDTVKNDTGKTSIYGKDISVVRAEYPNAEIVSMDYAMERINEALKEKYPMLDPKEITEEEFYNMFECLPPMQLKTTPEGMTFKMSELTYMDITSGYVHKGDKYYSMNVRIKTPHETMLAVIK